MSMLFLYDTFKPSCEHQGINLLSEDMRHICNCLRKIPEDRHKIIMKEYQAEWKRGIIGFEESSKEMNKGRSRANSWLSDMCDYN